MDYRTLAPTARTAVLAALAALANAPAVPNTPSDDRAATIQAIIDDIVAAKASKPSRLTTKDISLALAAVKSLGRVAAGSEVIATEQNLRHMLDLASDLGSPDASKQAMRCIANALLLVPTARDILVDLDGDELCTRLYIDNPSVEYLFLASRLLYFMSHTDGEFIARAVKQYKLPTLLAQRLESVLSAVQSDTPFARDALTDMLKLHFTAVNKYARLVALNSDAILGEYWDDVFDPTAAPLVRLFHSLPSPPSNPLAPPLTHVVHALLNIPVAPYAHLLFPSDSNLSVQSTSTRRSSSSGTQSPRPSLSVDRPTGSAVETSSSGGSPLARALNLLNRKSSPNRSTSKSPTPTSDSALRALSLLQNLLAVHLPGTLDPDDSAVRNASKLKGVVLDEVASPVVALVTRFVLGDDGARARISAVVLPPDMDRSSPLEKRDDFLGRCLRLMTSVYYPTLKDGIGEMLYTICGSDGPALSAAIGYGNAAGFLYNRGIMAPPPGSSAGDDVNPITGTREVPSGPPLADMSDEEKQREAERLFVLFERMERMGMAKNPIREAFHSGKFQGP
ncbi:Synembryn-A [Ceratobasidium theobromae]|uniref:Synembryn-A n=1 Tax=Ceratobasidium theobromae TaxID=1582974 RepID=A0A5N5QME6_9AGAM|nr:Synembryn-A [Ceratobasidium theobromae]